MMNILGINVNARSLRRVRQVIGVLIGYGFESLIEHLHFTQFMARGARLFRRGGKELAQLSPAERMRLALEELGPSFIKLGQLLSTRSDIIPRSYLEEFSKLQDQVPGFAFSHVRTLIREELGGEIEDIYASFSEEPLAAASIAQVHAATLKSGDEVVVKIRRPGIVEEVETDIEVLLGLAFLAKRRFPDNCSFDPVELVKEFARSIRCELELSREGRTIERISGYFADEPTVRFPRVYWEVTSPGVLTLECMRGIKVSDLAALERAGLDRKLIARRGADVFIRQVLEHGYFHGDPHPGNVFILPGNVICLLDFGMMGRLDSSSREFFVDFLRSLVNKDPDRIISLLLYSGDISDTLDSRALRRDLSDFIDDFYELPFAEMSVGKILGDLITLIAAYRIYFRPDFMMLAKALVTVEGMGRMLDPEFDMVERMRPFVEKAATDRLSMGHIAQEVGGSLQSYYNLARTFPDDIKEILNRLNRNKFKIDLEHRGLEHFIRELDKSGNRLSSSLIIAALLIGSSLIMQTDKGPHLLGVPILAFLGYTVAGLMGVWLLVGIFRSGRL
ncbi:MAG: AarF/ABC1/UbiB kinase family protein [Deltaproteobacteria bacterium]|nr:AarF/ABC1/UbiB kinase family protein [Deltaproteobacteria bacterium]TLN05097.1 MAG: AarF/ABC1/UbiB kinase family protein [bacterium]